MVGTLKPYFMQKNLFEPFTLRGIRKAKTLCVSTCAWWNFHYLIFNKSVALLQRNNIWNRIEQYKPVFVEPRNKHEFLTAMENFYEKINDPAQNGAVFAAVCRGKVLCPSFIVF